MSLEKNFDDWNVVKKQLNLRSARKRIKERDILFLSIGENVGFEQNGKGEEFLRPVLVYKKFSKYTFWGIPLTKTQKSGDYYFSFSFKGEQSTAILSQLRLFDTKRIKYFYGRLREDTFGELKKRAHEVNSMSFSLFLPPSGRRRRGLMSICT